MRRVTGPGRPSPTGLPSMATMAVAPRVAGWRKAPCPLATSARVNLRSATGIWVSAAAEAQMPVAERKFTLAEVANGQGAFLHPATLGATAIVAIDGKPVGDGRPGPVTRRIQELYRHAAELRARGGKAGASDRKR